MASLEQSVGSVIDRLFVNQRLPKYQFERASEPLLSLFIEEALGIWLKTSLTFVVAEFPLKKPDNAQSTNSDYLFKRGDGDWLLVEVKTEPGTVRPEQLEVYSANCARPFGELVAAIKEIRGRTTKKSKYKYLLHQLDRHQPHTGTVQMLYITPREESSLTENRWGIKWVTFEQLFRDFRSVRHPDLWAHVSRLARLVGATEEELGSDSIKD